MILADISNGNTGFADIMFLVGFILFVIAFIVTFPTVRPPGDPWWRTLVSAGLACIALAWLVL